MFTPFRITVGLIAAYLTAKSLWNGYYVFSLPCLLLGLYIFEPIYIHLRAHFASPQPQPSNVNYGGSTGKFDFNAPPPKPPPESRVLSEYLDMRMNTRTRRITGRVRKGQFADRYLSDLSLNELLELATEIAANDAEGERLLETYLNVTHPNWQEEAARRRWAAEGGKMTRKRALELLGLKEGATREEITSAWKAALKRNHPDTGGTDALAALINQAKECLLP